MNIFLESLYKMICQITKMYNAQTRAHYISLSHSLFVEVVMEEVDEVNIVFEDVCEGSDALIPLTL